MAGFTKLCSSIITSSIWSEDDKTRIMWVTMLAVSDARGHVDGSVPGMAAIARMSLEDARKAIAKLEAPDPDSRTKDYEGRRIISVDDGWQIVNYAKYREQRDPEVRAQQNREAQNRWRDRHSKPKVSQSNPEKAQAEAEAEAEETPYSPPAGDELFNRFWKAYPRKIGKGAARKAFAKCKATPPLLETMLKAVARQKESADWRKEGGQYIPNPATWLNQERWDDEVAPVSDDDEPNFDKVTHPLTPEEDYEVCRYSGYPWTPAEIAEAKAMDARGEKWVRTGPMPAFSEGEF